MKMKMKMKMQDQTCTDQDPRQPNQTKISHDQTKEMKFFLKFFQVSDEDELNMMKMLMFFILKLQTKHCPSPTNNF